MREEKVKDERREVKENDNDLSTPNHEHSHDLPSLTGVGIYSDVCGIVLSCLRQ